MSLLETTTATRARRRLGHGLCLARAPTLLGAARLGRPTWRQRSPSAATPRHAGHSANKKAPAMQGPQTRWRWG